MEFKSDVKVENLVTDRWNEFKSKIGEEPRDIGEGTIVDTGLMYFKDKRPVYVWRSAMEPKEYENILRSILEDRNPMSYAYKVSCPEVPPPNTVQVSVDGIAKKLGRKPEKMKLDEKVKLLAWKSESGGVIYGF